MKKPGCCTFCDKPVYHIKTRWTKGLLEGEPRKIGKPTHEAIRVHYVVSDGTTMTLTFCFDCLPKAVEVDNFTDIHRIVMEAFSREVSPDYVEAIEAPPRTEVQQEAASNFVAGFANTSIIGVMGFEKADEALWKNA